jgi:hypothetical protein
VREFEDGAAAANDAPVAAFDRAMPVELEEAHEEAVERVRRRSELFDADDEFEGFGCDRCRRVRVVHRTVHRVADESARQALLDVADDFVGGDFGCRRRRDIVGANEIALRLEPNERADDHDQRSGEREGVTNTRT